MGVARVVRPVAHGASSHRRAEAASLYSSLYGGTSPRVQVVRGRAAATQGPSALGVGPMRVRRAVTAANAVPLGARATVYAPRPLGVESSGSAAPLPATGECSSGVAPWPVTAECGKVRSVARARGAPRQFTETIARRTTLSAVVKLYYIMWQRHVCVQLARGRAAAAQGSSILMEWARYWFDGRSQRFGPCRSSLALPLTRLARWGWRAAGAQRLSRSGMSAAGGMRLSRWRLSAARSSPVRGLVAHLVNSPRTRRGDFRRPRRKQTSCWPNSRLGF